MALFKLLLGIMLLVMGRRLFWLFLGGLGFMFGFDFADRIIQGQPYKVILIIAFIFGVLGALAAIFLQKFAVAAGGFFVGGYLLIEMLKILGLPTSDYHWLFFIAGGLVGAFLMSVLFGWTLIVLSSLIGSILILQTFHLGQPLSKFIFVCLAIVGMGIQFGLIRKKSPQ
jgi:hypothetical protein